jgi:uncharacterized repeat protein (TIGR01451 family)
MPHTFSSTLKSIAFYVNMDKLILSITATAVIGLATAGSTYASYGSEACTPIYGGGVTCETSNKFVLDKKVLNPESISKGGAEVYVDNLSINDPKYVPGQTIKFELNVTNTGTSTLNTLTLTDILPSYVNFVSGSGNFNEETNTLRFDITNLNAGETRKFIIVGTIDSAETLPSDQGITCVVNQASVTFENDESKDNSQFCIEKVIATTKGGLPVMPAPDMEQTPSTGPGLALLGLIPAALGGLLLRRKAK